MYTIQPNFPFNSPVIARDVVNGGKKRYASTVKRDYTPGRYRVLLFRRLNLNCVYEVWSKRDGTFSMDWLADNNYFAIAFDHSAEPKNASIVDYVPLTDMP